MKKTTRKLLSLLLALAMILTLAPIAVFAEDEPAPADPVVVEEPAEPVEEPVEEPAEDPGSVVAVVYGDAMEAALLAVEQDYNLLEDEFLGEVWEVLNREKYKGRTIPKLQDIKGDATPEATFVLEDADGNAVELVKDEAPKGSEYVEIIGEKTEMLTEALDGIQANNFTVYRVDGLAPGNYTLKLTYMVEPYGIRNAVALSQSVLVESGKTTIAGSDSIEVRGHVNVKEQVEDGTEQVRVIVGYEEVTHTGLFGYTWTTQEPIYEYVEQTKYKTVTTPYEHTLNFKGYFLRKEVMGFKFRTTDVVGTAVEGASFVMVNRDELLGLLEPVLGIGKDLFTAAIGEFTGENLPTFEDLVEISQTILAQDENGLVTISREGIQQVITGYIATLTKVLQSVDYASYFIEKGEEAGPLGFKLKHPLPAILEATSDENGVVTFNESSNATLTFLIDAVMNLGMETILKASGGNEAIEALMFPVRLVMDPDSVKVDDLNVAALANLIDLIPSLPGVSDTVWNTIKTTIKNAVANGDNAIDAIFSGIDWAVNLIPGVNNFNSKETLWNGIVTFVKNSKDTIMNFLYGQLQNMGLVGDKISKGNYLLFEYKTPDAVLDEEGNVVEDYARSPLVYTLNLDWKEPDNVYATVTDLGLIGPYIAPQFYDFVRNTNYEGVVAKYLGKKAWDYDFLSKLMTGRIALTETAKQQVQGAFTAFMADSLYDALGLDLVFNSRVALMQGMNDYLLSQKDTANNLRTYVNAQARKAKSVYAGTLTPIGADVAADDLWTFYTLDASPTTTATKLINKSVADIAEQYPEGSERQKGVIETGNAVSNIVNRIGTSIENTVKSVVQRIKTAFGETISKVTSGITEGIKNAFSSLLKSIFNGGSDAETPAEEVPVDAGA